MLKQFSIYRTEIQLSLKIFICCETLHKYLNEKLKIHVISIIWLQSRVFSRLIKTSRYRPAMFNKKPQHLITNLMPFSHKILNIYSRTQSCNENKLTPMCCFVELTTCITYFGKTARLFPFLSLYDAVIFIYKVYLRHVTSRKLALTM